MVRLKTLKTMIKMSKIKIKGSKHLNLYNNFEVGVIHIHKTIKMCALLLVGAMIVSWQVDTPC
jgi:hypothetical protein